MIETKYDKAGDVAVGARKFIQNHAEVIFEGR